ncbi:hypothetical protein Rhopal_002189-T1 [Rhodotorula paludigena]|uniref:4-nitrophenylphosphatase n=1 Tax=Rhodotorula paludigena TaxID=86838 RepID=A0AAV5G9K4_9BASI|nr:hypothetical protein Rhopal_002189-T1 [Rhodotorula paludigena]
MSPRTLSTPEDFKELVDAHDVWLFDCDGVIWEGDHVIGKAGETLQLLRKLGKRIFFVTNNATKSRESNKGKFDKMGIECAVDEIFTSAFASAAYLKSVLDFPEDKKVYVIGEKGIEDELDAVGIKHSGGTDPADNRFVDLMDFSAVTADPEVGAVLCGLDMHMNYLKYAKAFRYLRENENCLFMATNLDSTFPTHGTVHPEPLVVGKPEAAMLESIIQTHKLDKSKMIMVGDRLNTDIAFGNKGGIDTLMVLTGIDDRAGFEKEDAPGVPTARLPNPFARSHAKNRSGILEDGFDKRGKLSTKRLAGVLLFVWTYEVHVEIQLFSRGWVRKTILPVQPASSTCFDPSRLAASGYNQTLADSPAYVDVHAGLGMPLGRDCYNFAATLPRRPLPAMILPEHTVFHTYWRSDLLQLGSRQITLLHSILATQDRSSTSVILWTNAPSPSTLSDLPILQPLLELYGERLAVRSVNKRDLARGTPMEDHKLLELADTQAWVDGDLVRILVLHALGGIWVDMDTIMTGRDMRVLGEHEWVTQWDCYDKVYQPLNGAMMHFYRASPYLCEMLHSMATSPPPAQNSVDWGSRLYHKVWRSLLARGTRPFKVLPYCFTDGVSCRLDNRLPDPFGERGAEKRWGRGRWEDVQSKVRSVWAVHLHNRWDKTFPEKGWVDQMIVKPVMARAQQYRYTPNSG